MLLVVADVGAAPAVPAVPADAAVVAVVAVVALVMRFKAHNDGGWRLEDGLLGYGWMDRMRGYGWLDGLRGMDGWMDKNNMFSFFCSRSSGSLQASASDSLRTAPMLAGFPALAFPAPRVRASLSDSIGSPRWYACRYQSR